MPMGGAVGQHWGHDVGLTPSPCHRDLLQVLSAEELCLLERSLCTAELEDSCVPATPPAWGAAMPRADPPAPWGLLEVAHTTPPPPTCTTQPGPPGAVDNLGTNSQWGCVAGRERGQDGRSPPAGMGTFCATPGVTVASPLCSPQPPESSPGTGLDATPGARCLELRSRYSSTKDMLHTLFVCISGE